MSCRLVFMGSPEFALPTLYTLHRSFTVVGVVTQPDRPAGRGRTLQPPPVKSLALELALPLIQPARLRDPEAMQQLGAWQPDLIVVAAYGQILRPAVLDLPPHGCINVHASLLPRWRGASPIQAALLHGDSQTGITIMQMDPGMDTGPILSQRAIPIHPDDSAGTLSQRLAHLGAELLAETLPPYLAGDLIPRSQDDSLATPAPLLKKSDGLLDYNRTAAELERQVRAFHPWPAAFVTWRGQPLKIVRVRVVETKAPPGRTLIHAGLPAVGTSRGILLFEELQPAGKRSMSGESFLLGARDWGSIDLSPQ